MTGAPGTWPPGSVGTAGAIGPPYPPPPATSCAATAILVPTCGAWWGIAPEVFTGRSPARALERAEARVGRRAGIVHVYHRGAELFPTAGERSIAAGPGGPRLLLVNWKPSFDRTWAEIARGALDRRIDRLAGHIRRTFPGRFFLTVHHEPENDVREEPGSGMTAADYAAMFRHVVTRLRERGVRNAVTVMTYMGAPNWAVAPWFTRLYPGDDVIDWVALDPYLDPSAGSRTGSPAGSDPFPGTGPSPGTGGFAGLVDRTRPDAAGWPGFHRWMRWRFPDKPIMLAEWGVFERPGMPGAKAAFFAAVRREMRLYPQIKALVYFDSPRAPRGDTRFDATADAARAFTGLVHDPYLGATPVPQE
ncbi:hypothetical protein AB0D67_07715 [Streptosporangium sp. NPDC048047]|uniref:hypothetical protein n=1 Tax=Streptosporangium sp. NPDC048047 TaxID=3155748 RepID=UPI003437E23F